MVVGIWRGGCVGVVAHGTHSKNLSGGAVRNARGPTHGHTLACAVMGHAPLISRLRSVSGKHAPVVRPRCGFESCRRLLPTPVAQWTERCPATAAAAGSTPAGRTDSSRGRSSDGRAPGFHPGEARSIRVVRSLKARGVTQRAWRALTSSVRVRILAGLLPRGRWCNSSIASSNLAGPGANPGRPVLQSHRRGPERLGYLLERAARSGCAVRPRASDRTPRPRRHPSAAGRSGSGYRLLCERSQLRILPGAFALR